MTPAPVFSADRRYRYRLPRVLGAGPRILWCLINPSVADEERDDPTSRRLIGYSSACGFGILEIVNVFAWVSTDPRVLRDIGFSKARGPENDTHLRQAAAEADLVIAAWGVPAGTFYARKTAQALGRPLACLGTNQDGSPRHPLYLDGELWPVPYEVK